MELLVKPEILTSYIFGATFGDIESTLFLFAAQCFNTESMQKVIYIYISYPVAQLCVNTLLATKVTLITDEI
jgi:CTP synthase (UTP-ammonia lyase)